MGSEFLVWDINENGRVGIFDLIIFGNAYGSSDPNPDYNPNADFNGDGDVNLVDFADLGIHWGETN